MNQFTLVALFTSCMISNAAYALGNSQNYERCMRTVMNKTEDIKACQLKEFKIQNKRMEKQYKLTLKSADLTEKESVKVSQDIWLKSRENVCRVQNNKPKDYVVSQTSCLLQMTTSHADMLEVRLSNKN